MSRITYYQRMLSKNPDSKDYKIGLALEYYKEAGQAGEKNLCKVYLAINLSETDSYCAKSLELMETLFNTDLKINDILIKEHYNYATYNQLTLKANKIKDFFLNTLNLGWFLINHEEYDKFLYLKKSSEQIITTDPLYTHYLSFLAENKMQREEYLRAHKNYSPSIYELGLHKKNNGQYADAIKYFKHGSDKSDNLSSCSIALLMPDFQPNLKSLEFCDNDQGCIYVYLFYLIDLVNYKKVVFEQHLAELDEYSDFISANKLKSLKSLSPIMMQKSIGGEIVLEEKDFNDLDGHAVALLGYLALNEEAIDSKSFHIIESMRERVLNSASKIDKSTNQGSKEVDMLIEDKKNISSQLHHSFAIKLLTLAAEKGYTPANLFLGKLYYQRLEYQEAEKYLMDSYKNGDFGSLYPLAKLHIQNHKYSEAFNYLLKSSEINPFAKYTFCTFYIKGYHVNQDIQEAQECLNSIMQTTNNDGIKGLVNYTLATLSISDRYSDNFNLQKANQYLAEAQKYDYFNIDYLKIIIDMKSNNCKNVKARLLEAQENNMYFKYLMAVDYIQGSCLTKDISKAINLSKEIIGNDNFNDENIINCAIQIIENNQIQSDCIYLDNFFYDLSSLDYKYIEPTLSDLYEEVPFLFLPNLGHSESYIMSFINEAHNHDL